MTNTTETVALGRPVNPNSARQKRLAELAEKRANGECKRGRPIVEGSERVPVGLWADLKAEGLLNPAAPTPSA